MKFLILFSFLLCLQSANSETVKIDFPGPSDEQQREGQAIAALIQATKELAANDIACESTSDCKVLSLGSKACGGPTGYAVVSKLNFNYKTIRALAQETQSMQSAYNQKYGVISDCSLMMAPQVTCLENICQRD